MDAEFALVTADNGINIVVITDEIYLEDAAEPWQNRNQTGPRLTPRSIPRRLVQWAETKHIGNGSGAKRLMNGNADNAAFNAHVQETVRRIIKKANKPPFLFIGSGVSRRYMNAPDWESLLRMVCDEFPFMGPFSRYAAIAANRIPVDPRNSEAKRKGDQLPYVASEMEKAFLQGIYDVPERREWLNAHDSDITHGISPMKIFLSEILGALSPSLMLDELSLLSKASRMVAGVITTNYDRLMESIFPDFDVYCRQDDLIFSPLAEVGEIYKIHGSVDAPETMVLDAEDYEKLNTDQRYMLAKIMTVFAEYPIIFIGYSYNDSDVRRILETIAQCAGEQRTEELSSRFVFIDYSTDYKVIEKDYGSNVLMMTIQTNDFSPIYTAIAESPQRFAPKVVRQLRQQVVQAAYSEEPAMQAILAQFADLDELPSDAPIVVGIEQHVYGRAPEGDDLYEEVLFEKESIPASIVVSYHLDRMLRQRQLPVYYFVRQYSGSLGEKVREYLSTCGSMETFLNDTQRKRKIQWRNRLPQRSIAGLQEQFGNDAYKHLTLLDESEIDVNELRTLLKAVAVPMREKNGKFDSDMRKDIRILDYLAYGKSYSTLRKDI